VFRRVSTNFANATRLIKKVAHTYRCYLTCLGRAAIAAACSLTRFSIVPVLATAH
jgi:hypothetical protein